MNRVAITGAGTVNPLGLTVRETFAMLAEGRSVIGRLDGDLGGRLPEAVGAQVRGFDPDAHLPARLLGESDRFTLFALVAARQAIAASGLTLDPDLSQRTGVILGTAGGGLATIDAAFERIYAQKLARVSPLTVPKLMHSAAASQVGRDLGLTGPTFSVSSACASSNHALGLAFQMVRSGAAPAMLAGGTEAMLTFGGLKAWEGLRVLSPDGCRPFCATRNGMVIGEGAAVFVLEAWDHAVARGADILAEFAGFAMGADAKDLVQPSAEGAARAMAAALSDARLNGGDIDYINAHGTGTRLNDATECAAIHAALGTQGARVAVSSTKSMHGHLIGAAGAVELLACILALRQGIVSPTAGHRQADPACAVDLVTQQARDMPVRATLSNAFAFGGLNAVIALKRA